MEKVINSYETLFIVDVENGEDAAKASVAKFTDIIAKNAEVVEVSDWGKRRLAYPINDMPEGYYVVVTFKAEPTFPAEFERLANIDESVLRSMVIKLDYDAAERKAKKAAEAAAKAAEAVVAPEAEVVEAVEAVEATETTEA